MSHLIESIQGIGDVYGDKLTRIGIATTNDMIVFGPEFIFNRLEGSVSRALIDKWHAMSLLMLIKGIGPNEAEILAHSKRDSWQTLDDTSPERLQNIFEQSEQGDSIPSTAQIARWQRKAVQLQYTGFIAGRVMSKKETPISNARIRVGNEETQTDQSGSYVLAGIPFWEKAIIVSATGYFSFETVLSLSSNALQRMDIKLADSPNGWSNPVRISEWESQVISFQTGDRFKKMDMTVDDLPDNTPLAEYHRGRYNDGLIRLVSIYKIREGNQIILFRIKVKPEQIRGPVSEGRLVLKTAEGLVTDPRTVEQFQDEWLRKASWITPENLTKISLERREA